MNKSNTQCHEEISVAVKKHEAIMTIANEIFPREDTRINLKGFFKVNFDLLYLKIVLYHLN